MEEFVSGVKVGKPAPDFEAEGFINGKFKKVKLSDYRGKWVVVCFFPAAYTFV
jgi:peroxiredoxin (alkyl hydroperoxide reductase subunit C)